MVPQEFVFGGICPTLTQQRLTMGPRSKKKAEKEAEAKRQEALLAQLELEVFGGMRRIEPGELGESEVWWSQHYQWLKDSGYLLRPRYAPDWTPSWQGTKKNWTMCEDSLPADFPSRILDGTRLSDGEYVALKRLPRLPTTASQSMKFSPFLMRKRACSLSCLSLATIPNLLSIQLERQWNAFDNYLRASNLCTSIVLPIGIVCLETSWWTPVVFMSTRFIPLFRQ